MNTSEFDVKTVKYKWFDDLMLSCRKGIECTWLYCEISEGDYSGVNRNNKIHRQKKGFD